MRRFSSFSRPLRRDSVLLHVDGKPVSDRVVDLAVALASSTDRQVDGRHEDRVLDHQRLGAGVRTTPHVAGPAV